MPNPETLPEGLNDLYSQLSNFMDTYPLDAAGRFLGWSPIINAFVLYAQTTGGQTPEGIPKDLLLRDEIYADIPEGIKEEMQRRDIGFALQPLIRQGKEKYQSTQ